MEKTLKNITNHIREQILEYALWRADNSKNLEEFKNSIKKDIKNMHIKNMNHLDKEINNK